jgi:hypothetical protein
VQRLREKEEERGRKVDKRYRSRQKIQKQTERYIE